MLFPTDGALLCVSLQLFTCQIFTALQASNFINTVRLYVTLSVNRKIEIEKKIEIVFCHQFFGSNDIEQNGGTEELHWKYPHLSQTIRTGSDCGLFCCCCCCCYFRPFCAEALAAGFCFCVKQSQALCPFFQVTKWSQSHRHSSMSVRTRRPCHLPASLLRYSLCNASRKQTIIDEVMVLSFCLVKYHAQMSTLTFPFLMGTQ